MRISAELRFGVLFLGGFAVLSWLTRDPPPLPVIAGLIRHLTEGQTIAAAGALRLVGQDVGSHGTLLSGARFSCEVGSGCSGLQALILAWAAILAFPVAPRARLAGFFALTPAILLVNIGRIVGLWLAGAHRPDLFDLGHVYVGQVVIILITAGLWWTWARRHLDSAGARAPLPA